MTDKEGKPQPKAYCDKDGSRRTSDGRYWQPFPDRAQSVWNPKTFSYGGNANYASSQKRTIRAWRSGDTITPGGTCHWKLEGVNPDWVTMPCDNSDIAKLYHATFEIGTTHKLLLTVGDDPTVHSRDVRVDDILIATIGDSFASGEGNPHTFRVDAWQRKNRRLETWLDERCHRSFLAYPTMAASIAAMLDRQMGTEVKHTFTSMNFACSGAAIQTGLLNPYAGREEVWQLETLSSYFPDAGSTNEKFQLPSQIDQLKSNLCGGAEFPCPGYRPPDYLIISIGGNDIGFGNIIRDFVTHCESVESECAINNAEAGIQKLVPHFDALAEAVAGLGVRRKIFLVEYPDLTHNETGAPCDDFNMRKALGPTSLGQLDYWIDLPLINIGVSREESEKAYKIVLRPLNKLLLKVASKHNWTGVSGAEHQSGFKGWCAQPSWFVRWIDSKNKQGMLPDPEDRQELSDKLTTGIAHPNIFGHNWLNWQIRCQLEKDGVLPQGSTQSGGIGAAGACGAFVPNATNPGSP